MRGRRDCARWVCSAKASGGAPPTPLPVPPPFTVEEFRRCLDEALPTGATGLAVAVSGGGDSARLLAALQRLGPEERHELPLRALHVDHGLQLAAARLRGAAEALCRTLKVPLSVLEVRIETCAGESVEEAARAARYRALGAALGPGECLLSAHHQEDQAETLLLQLLRGAGLAGLAAMPRCRVLGLGWHVRPLLEVSRAHFRTLHPGLRLRVCEDPMNADLRFDRVFLRERLWPLMQGRWPGVARTLGRSAAHLAEAQTLLARHGRQLLAPLRDGDALDLRGLRRLEAAERVAVLRLFIAAAGARLPSTARLHEALRQMLEAGPDRLPAIVWGEHALRRYRDRLYLTPARPPRLEGALEWRVPASEAAQDAMLELPDGLGRLRWEPARGGLDPRRVCGRLEVRGRGPPAALRIAPGGRTHSIRQLMQAWGVRPWMRDALPFIHAQGTLLAVGDLWHNVELNVGPQAMGVRCRWEDAPALT